MTTERTGATTMTQENTIFFLTFLFVLSWFLGALASGRATLGASGMFSRTREPVWYWTAVVILGFALLALIPSVYALVVGVVQHLMARFSG